MVNDVPLSFLFTKTVYPKLQVFGIFIPVNCMEGNAEHVDTEIFEIYN